MIKRSSKKVTVWLILVTVFTIAGCEQGYKEEAVIDQQETEKDIVAFAYALRTMEATGGLESWKKVNTLKFDCVVTLYRPDGSYYLTEHHYDVYPWVNSIRISAREPQGKYVCQLSPDNFTIYEGDDRLCSWPTGLNGCWFAGIILDITTAPVRLLDESVVFTVGPGPVKMEGRWYHPIKRGRPDEAVIDAKPYSESVFYQNRDNSRVDMLWFASVDPAGNKQGLAIRGYDYRKVEKKGVQVPHKLEIFRTDARRGLHERIVKIDIY